MLTTGSSGYWYLVRLKLTGSWDDYIDVYYNNGPKQDGPYFPSEQGCIVGENCPPGTSSLMVGHSNGWGASEVIIRVAFEQMVGGNFVEIEGTQRTLVQYKFGPGCVTQGELSRMVLKWDFKAPDYTGWCFDMSTLVKTNDNCKGQLSTGNVVQTLQAAFGNVCASNICYSGVASPNSCVDVLSMPTRVPTPPPSK